MLEDDDIGEDDVDKDEEEDVGAAEEVDADAVVTYDDEEENEDEEECDMNAKSLATTWTLSSALTEAQSRCNLLAPDQHKGGKKPYVSWAPAMIQGCWQHPQPYPSSPLQQLHSVSTLV